jgi:hypothetical protein
LHLRNQSNKPLSNHEIVTIAVYLLGGDSHHIDTEDVAIKANEIAPRRFTWKKYPAQINIENVRTFLSDAKKQKNGGLLVGSGINGWLLTEKGIAFVKQEHPKMIPSLHSGFQLSHKDKNFRKNERVRLLASEAFQKFRNDGIDAVSVEEIRSFFRLDDYVSAESVNLKIERTVNLFGDDPELGDVVRALINRLRRKSE